MVHRQKADSNFAVGDFEKNWPLPKLPSGEVLSQVAIFKKTCVWVAQFENQRNNRSEKLE